MVLQSSSYVSIRPPCFTVKVFPASPHSVLLSWFIYEIRLQFSSYTSIKELNSTTKKLLATPASSLLPAFMYETLLFHSSKASIRLPLSCISEIIFFCFVVMHILISFRRACYLLSHEILLNYIFYFVENPYRLGYK